MKLGLVVALVVALPSTALARPATTLIAGLRGGDAALAASLTDVLATAAERRGATVERATLDDVLAISGCPTPDPACLDSAPAMLEAERIVFGELESTAGGVVVHLTMIAADGTTRRRDVALGGQDEAMAGAFASQADAFLAARPAPPVAVGPIVEPERGGSLARVSPWAWAIAGGGVVAATVGVALLVSASNVQDEVDDAPTESVADLERLADLEDEGRGKARWGGVTLALGGAAIVVGACLVIHQATADHAEVRVAPTALGDRGGAGLMLTIGAPR